MSANEDLGKVVAEAAQSLPSLCFSAVIILVAAYTLLPANMPKTAELSAARDLSAWMALNELSTRLTEVSKNGEISRHLSWMIAGGCGLQNNVNDHWLDPKAFSKSTCFDEWCEKVAPSTSQVLDEECEALSITPRWPSLTVIPLELHRTAGPALLDDPHRAWMVEGYKPIFKGYQSQLPLSRYMLVHLIPTEASRTDQPFDFDNEWSLKAERWAVTTLNTVQPSGKISNVFLYNLDRPDQWQRIAPYLYAFGKNPDQPWPTSSDGYAQKFFAHASTATADVNIIGISLDPLSFVAGIGILLGAIGLAVFGPVITLMRQRKVKVASSWIFLIPAADGMTGVAIILILLEIAFALAPLGVIYVQWQVFEYVLPYDFGLKLFALLIGDIGLIWCTVVFACLGVELSRRRNARD